MERPHKRDLPQCPECLDTGLIEYPDGDDEGVDYCECEAGRDLRWRDEARAEDDAFRRMEDDR